MLPSQTGLLVLLVAVLGNALLYAETAPVPIEEGPAQRAFVRNSEDGGKERDESAPKPDKSRYNLFRPTPADQMRDMSADRPDATESPRTVDAGHFQIEAGVFAFTLDTRNPDREKKSERRYDIWNTNYKFGLFNNVDFHIVVPSYTIDRIRENGHLRVHQGFGDVTVRSKINVLGNDDDGPGVAILPYIKLPTNQDSLGNKSVEGGVKTPWSVTLPKGWTVAGQAEFDCSRDDRGGGYHLDYGGTYEFSHSIGVESLSGFLEFSALASTANHSPWVGTFNTGLSWKLNENLILDGGVNIGLTRSADDITAFYGFSVRF